MDNIPRISQIGNEFLKEIYDQLPADAQLLFSKLLSDLAKPSPAEYALQALVNELHEDNFYDLLEGCCLDGGIDKNQFDALHHAYPSILSEDIYQSLLSYFEE